MQHDDEIKIGVRLRIEPNRQRTGDGSSSAWGEIEIDPHFGRCSDQLWREPKPLNRWHWQEETRSYYTGSALHYFLERWLLYLCCSNRPKVKIEKSTMHPCEITRPQRVESYMAASRGSGEVNHASVWNDTSATRGVIQGPQQYCDVVKRSAMSKQVHQWRCSRT
jgi:hypothetical protein